MILKQYINLKLLLFEEIFSIRVRTNFQKYCSNVNIGFFKTIVIKPN